ncbi:CynX/NimT family MFS transporter [Halobacillus campisalis]|uniref:CynX/NimT family MFS transporter n=1 Tax=Halobacillus campisalis TaxID=435909 RepID=A0ABW2K9C0_9BACI|nr:MFS transporter [Halobacillus campisalis]
MAGIILVAFNLRPSLTAVGPLVGSIREEFMISNGTAGVLTTLPLVAFAILSAVAPRLSLRIGNGRSILLGLVVLTTGIVFRSVEWITALFAGTALIGIGVAICNVLLPAIVKQHFPAKVGLLTGLYSISMSAFAALGSGVSYPLADSLAAGWQGSLRIWAVLALIGLIVWLPQARLKRKPERIPKIDIKNSPLFRSKIAWQVTLFMGLQSFMFYCLITWLPEILQSRGMAPSEAGWMLSWLQLVGLPITFLTPVLAGRMKNQQGIVWGIGSVYIIGLFILLFSEDFITLVLAVALMGIAQGGAISLALTLISLRAPSAVQASNLSGMAQSFGYFLAAVGPVSIGFLFDEVQSWTIAILIFLLVVLGMILSGNGAGRNRCVPKDK